MSYDLVWWRSQTSVKKPAELWEALHEGAKREAGTPVPDVPWKPVLSYDDAKALVMPLDVAPMIVAFRKEFGDQLEVDPEGSVGTQVIGPGWEFSLRDGAYFAHVTCRWGIAEPMLAKLRRAGLRARCSTFDLQTSDLFQPTE